MEIENCGWSEHDQQTEWYRELMESIPQARRGGLITSGALVGERYFDAEERLLVVGRSPTDWKESDLRKNPFQRVSRTISRWLLDRREEDWYENIARTSLYKIAPRCGAPLDFVFRDYQREACRRILIEEIEQLRPDYVLFLTGWSWVWDFELPLTPMLKGEAIEAAGRLGDARLIVSRQLGGRKPEDQLVEGIADWMEEMEEGEGI